VEKIGLLLQTDYIMNECMGNRTDGNVGEAEHELCFFLLLPSIETNYRSSKPYRSHYSD